MVPQRHVHHGEVVVLVRDGLQPRIEGVGHDLKAGPDACDDQVDVVTRTLVRTETLSTGDEQRHAEYECDDEIRHFFKLFLFLSFEIFPRTFYVSVSRLIFLRMGVTRWRRPLKNKREKRILY
jgi:hypothetical protein